MKPECLTNPRECESHQRFEDRYVRWNEGHCIVDDDLAAALSMDKASSEVEDE